MKLINHLKYFIPELNLCFYLRQAKEDQMDCEANCVK